MRRPVTILLAAAFAVAATAVPAMAWGPGCGAEADLAVKVWVADDYSGAQNDSECGRVKYSSGTQRLKDDNFGNESGDGTIEGMNDNVSSLKMWNLHPTEYVCFNFYEHADQTGRRINYLIFPDTNRLIGTIPGYYPVGPNDAFSSMQATNTGSSLYQQSDDSIW